MKNLTGLNEKIYDLEYIAQSKITKNNLSQILGNIALSNVPLYFKSKTNLLFLTKYGGDYYLFTDSRANCLNYHHLLNVDLYKFNVDCERIKMNLDYYAQMAQFAYLTNNDELFFEGYVNFRTFYFIFLSLYNKVKVSFIGKKSLALRPMVQQNFKLDIMNIKQLSCSGVSGFDLLKQILAARKLGLKRNINKYFLYSHIDFFYYYLGSDVQLNLLLDNYVYNKSYAMSRLLTIISKIRFKLYENKQLLDSTCKYNNYIYYSLKVKDKKLAYWYNLSNFYKKPYFYKYDIIKNYPSYSVTILEIQKDLNIT